MNSIISRKGSNLRSIIPTAALALVLGSGVGCEKKDGAQGKTAASAEGTVATVDLPRIAKALGWDNDFNEKMTATKADYERQINTYLDDLKRLLNELKERSIKTAKLSEKQADEVRKANEIDKLPLPDAQKAELAEALRVLNSLLQDAQNRRNQALAERERDINTAYNDAIRPVVRKVANANGYTAVSVPNTFLWADSAIDITDKVIDEGMRIKPDHPVHEARKLEFQGVQLNTPATLPSTAAPTSAPAKMK